MARRAEWGCVWGTVAALTIGGCGAAGDSVRRTLPPSVSGVPSVAVEPSVELDDGISWARAGATVTVQLPVDAPEGLDLDATSVSLTGIRLDPMGDGVWSRVLDGTEAEGLKELDVVLVDTLGQQVRVSDDLGQVGFDFTAPRAGCQVSPDPANGTQEVRLSVFPTEDLQGPPSVASSDGVTLGTPTAADDGWVVTVSGPKDANTGFTVDVTLTDRVGNTTTGDAACASADRSGSILGVPPVVDGDPVLTVTPTVSIDDVAAATRGAELTLVMPTDGPIDPRRSFVGIGGVVMSSTDGVTWRATLSGDEGDGPKSLFATLVDEVGNATVIEDPTVRFVADFTPPTLVGATWTRDPTWSPAAESDGDLLLSMTDPWTGAAVTATLRVVASEDLATDPGLERTGPGSMTTSAVDVDGRVAAWTVGPVVPADEGVHSYGVVLEDVVGNRSAVVPVGPSLTVDTTAPPPIAATGEGALVLVRRPWPDAAGTPTGAWIEDPGTAGCVGCTAVLEDAQGTVRDQASCTAGGAVPPLRSPSDLSSARVSLIDAAGNRSAAVAVGKERWTATLGGKVAGETTLNPHVFRTGVQGLRRRDGGAEVGDPGALAVAEAPVATSGAPRFRVVGSGHDSPPAVKSFAMATDAVRGGIVAFGGTTGSSDQDTTWVRREGAWTANPAVPGGPIARRQHQLVWDPSTQSVLLIGGLGAGQVLDDVWSWDGSAWRSLPAGPPARRLFGTAFDPIRQRVVVYGGYGADGQPMSDTWTWDGTAWTAHDLIEHPSTNSGFVMAWDPAGEAVIVVGGSGDCDGLCDETWAWDGVAWSEVTSAGPNPPGRAHAVGASDPSRDGVWLFGGRGEGSTYLDDTWFWDGVAWTDASVAGSPEARWEAGMAWDPDVGEAVLVGGSASTQASLEGVWSWDGSTWTSYATGPATLLTHYGSAVHDPVADEVVVVASHAAAGTLPVTWTWDGATWTGHDVVAPAERAAHDLAWDPSTQSVMLWAGDVGEWNDDETWSWDGVAWTTVSPASRPPARWDATLVGDPVREQVVVFGGLRSPTTFDETWIWDDGTWTSPTLGPRPPARSLASGAWDPVSERVVVFGGRDVDNDPLDDTWAWDGVQWTEVGTSAGVRPPARRGHAMATDVGAGRVVLFGGFGVDGSLDDVWWWSVDRWVQLDPGAYRPDPSPRPMLAWHEGSGGLVVIGAGSQDRRETTWVLDAGTDDRPVHDLEVAWGRADSSRTPIALVVRWRGGALGYDQGVAIPGRRLQAWVGWRWRDVAVWGGTPSDPEEGCWTLGEDGSVPVPRGCEVTTDAELLASLFHGVDEAIRLRVVPRTANGGGSATVATELTGSITSDVVEVEVWTEDADR